MAFGLYIHIPYCLQRCPYCDFATYEWDQIRPPQEYIEAVKKEIRLRAALIPLRQVDTIYFGGGTPSLLEPQLLGELFEALQVQGFSWSAESEITIEINPATIEADKLTQYKRLGINRYSVGAQTFSDPLLKGAGRKHDREDTLQTLHFLRENRANFTLDLLYSLPQQSLHDLQLDVATALSFAPRHISAYSLTVPENHPMQKGRAAEAEQVEMTQWLEWQLAQGGLQQYEISNFAVPGDESRHNMIYWTDQAYWGLGLSAHSYLPQVGHGLRFWNPRGLDAYMAQAEWAPSSAQNSIDRLLPAAQFENLAVHQALTDLCHIFLRLNSGLPEAHLEKKFGPKTTQQVVHRLKSLHSEGLVENCQQSWRLTARGRMISNTVFETLTFLEG